MAGALRPGAQQSLRNTPHGERVAGWRSAAEPQPKSIHHRVHRDHGDRTPVGSFLCDLCALRGESFSFLYSNEIAMSNRSTWKTARHIECLCVHSPYLQGCRERPSKILAKKTRFYALAMQGCSAFWDYSAPFIFSPHPQNAITNLRTAEFEKRKLCATR